MARNKSKARKAKVELSDPSTSQANGQQSTNMKRNKAKTIKVEPNEEVPKLSKAQRRKFRKAKSKIDKELEAPLAEVMQKYIGRSMPGKTFCKMYLKHHHLTNDQLISAIESPLGPQLLQDQNGSDKELYECLAEKIKAVLKLRNFNRNGRPKSIPNSQAGFDAFSGNLVDLLGEMKGELNSMNNARREHTFAPPHFALTGYAPSWWQDSMHPANSFDQKPSTSNGTTNDGFVEDQMPMEDGEDEAKLLIPSNISKRYSQLQFRRDELQCYDPNNTPMSDCDQSGSEDEVEDFNSHFKKKLLCFNQQRKAEVLRSRPFGVRKPVNLFQSKYLPSNTFRL